ncbi:MAG: VOC family protein [Porticoccaceae bacterium]
MSVRRLDHINICTARLAQSIAFYRDGIGMAVKQPPTTTDLSRGAYCHDCDDVPVVHLVATDSEVPGADPVRGAAQRGMIDHFALRCEGSPEEYRARLDALGLDYQAMDVPMIGRHLIFVRDPNGVMVELGFPLC